MSRQAWPVVLMLATSATSPPAWVGRFDRLGAPPPPWKMTKLGSKPPTAYKVALVAGRTALEARVDSSMSLMSRSISVDLARTPVLCWRWYVDGPILKADMTRKSGDDYAARLYIGFDMPDSALSHAARFKLQIARSIYGKAVIPDAAVVYVWDNIHPIGTARRSSYSDRVQLVVSETGAARAQTWVSERANIATDFARAFGKTPATVIQVAVASDGDNTKSRGRAAFADIHFVGSDQSCSF
jgi:hypothetical protein